MQREENALTFPINPVNADDIKGITYIKIIDQTIPKLLISCRLPISIKFLVRMAEQDFIKNSADIDLLSFYFGKRPLFIRNLDVKCRHKNATVKILANNICYWKWDSSKILDYKIPFGELPFTQITLNIDGWDNTVDEVGNLIFNYEIGYSALYPIETEIPTKYISSDGDILISTQGFLGKAGTTIFKLSREFYGCRRIILKRNDNSFVTNILDVYEYVSPSDVQVETAVLLLKGDIINYHKIIGKYNPVKAIMNSEIGLFTDCFRYIR